jgi:hypothetical protein
LEFVFEISYGQQNTLSGWATHCPQVRPWPQDRLNT